MYVQLQKKRIIVWKYVEYALERARTAGYLSPTVLIETALVLKNLRASLHLGQDGTGEVLGCRVSTHIASADGTVESLACRS